MTIALLSNLVCSILLLSFHFYFFSVFGCLFFRVLIYISGIDYCGRMYNKSSENILIEDCIFGSGHGVSLCPLSLPLLSSVLLPSVLFPFPLPQLLSPLPYSLFAFLLSFTIVDINWQRDERRSEERDDS